MTADSKNGFDISRRTMLKGSALIGAGLLAGCGPAARKEALKPLTLQDYKSMYAAMPDEEFPLPAINLNLVDSKYLRRTVEYDTDEKVGTLIVDTKHFYVYLVERYGLARRYGVGLGRAGFEWAGRAYVGRKAEWPIWVPPEEMIARKPSLERYSFDNGGMDPGLKNPLGSRAIYIYQDRVDTLYRLHGTPDVRSIGRAVSSGCVRMMNQDIIDLYDRVKRRAPIVVI
ncbi:L,D-transpeptidase [Cohaesibacter sp. ES.047]|uniref:L,D-transpeptidase family protein n=1 Tax=Cohaesibacter sp. ES.047 TaxID=1798205 RepID=UPI001FCE68F6|nr:L,D-transpeptidase [Cohaesibacter sp. ES.047]